jgi:Na+/melibiose symporter-like transporter
MSEVHKRLEGTVIACQTFMGKTAGVIGAVFAGVLLKAISFPQAADTIQASEATLAGLGLGCVISWLVRAAIGVGIISKSDINPLKHYVFVISLKTIQPTDN